MRVVGAAEVLLNRNQQTMRQRYSVDEARSALLS